MNVIGKLMINKFIFHIINISFDGENVQKIQATTYDHRQTSFAKVKDEFLVAIGGKNNFIYYNIVLKHPELFNV